MAGRLFEANGDRSNPARRPRFRFEFSLSLSLVCLTRAHQRSLVYWPEKFPITKAITAVRNSERNETEAECQEVRASGKN